MQYRRPINEAVAHALQGFVAINETLVSSANATKLYDGHADVTALAEVADNIHLAFKPHEDAVEVPVDSLVTHKNQNEDPKYQKGLKRHPVSTAAAFMAKAIAGEVEKRDPISVQDNGDGTFTVLDGNATSQAAMMVGADTIPVLVQGSESVEEGLITYGGIQDVDFVAEKNGYTILSYKVDGKKRYKVVDKDDKMKASGMKDRGQAEAFIARAKS